MGTTTTATTTIAYYDLWGEGVETGKDIEMKDITKENMENITVSLGRMPIDELKERIHPDADFEYQLADDDLEVVTACDVAREFMMELAINMASPRITMMEHKALGKTVEAYMKWDGTTRAVRYNGNGSASEKEGAVPRPFGWRIAAKMTQVKDTSGYYRTISSALEKMPVYAKVLPQGFLDDPPAGEVA